MEFVYYKTFRSMSQLLGDIWTNDNGEQLYVALRKQEGRIYTDNELRLLPEIDKSHKHYQEWVYRKRSFLRLIRYLENAFPNRKLSILDIGCGNGWMSNRLHIAGHSVTGLDTNVTELEQAKRVFGSSDSLKWINGNLFDEGVVNGKYDVIMLAASCQYFPDLDILTTRLKQLLNKGGQVHLIDSMFYNDKELEAAKERTREYYSRLGFPQMSEHYYHHSKEVVKALGYKRMYPSRLNILNRTTLEWWMLSC